MFSRYIVINPGPLSQERKTWGRRSRGPACPRYMLPWLPGTREVTIVTWNVARDVKVVFLDTQLVAITDISLVTDLVVKVTSWLVRMPVIIVLYRRVIRSSVGGCR